MSAKGLVLQALKDAARSNYSRMLGRFSEECLRSDESAVRYGPFVYHVALEVDMMQAATRRYLRILEAEGLVMREPSGMRGSSHRWWPVGFAEVLRGDA